MAVETKMMEVKKSQQSIKPVIVPTKERSAGSEQVENFFANIKSEFKKISWTNPEELRAYTKIVVSMTFIVGMGIYLMDLATQLVLSGFGHLIRLFGG